MTALFIAIVLPVLAQTDQITDVYYVTPKDESPFYAQRVSEDSDSFVFRRLEGRFTESGAVEVVLSDSRENILKKDVTAEATILSRAKKAIEDELNKEYAVVNGIPVSREIYRKANEARDAARALEDRLRIDIAVPETGAELAAAEPPPAPSVVATWGPQVALVLGALVLIAIIAKLMLIDE